MEIKFRFTLVNLTRAKYALKWLLSLELSFSSRAFRYIRERINGDIKLIDDNNWNEKKKRLKCALKFIAQLFPEIITLL